MHSRRGIGGLYFLSVAGDNGDKFHTTATGINSSLVRSNLIIGNKMLELKKTYYDILAQGSTSIYPATNFFIRQLMQNMLHDLDI